MMPFSNLSYIVVFYNCICVLKVNKIKWLNEEWILNCRFFGAKFWEELSKNGATLSSLDNSLWFSVHSKLQFMLIAIGRVDCRLRRMILLLKYAELLEMVWEKILSCHSWAIWTTLFIDSEKFHKWGEDFLDKVAYPLTQSYWSRRVVQRQLQAICHYQLYQGHTTLTLQSFIYFCSGSAKTEVNYLWYIFCSFFLYWAQGKLLKVFSAM